VIQESFRSGISEAVDDLPCRERLEVANHFAEAAAGRGNKMQVILQDHVTVDLQALVIDQELPGVQHDLRRLRPGEQRKPADNSEVQKCGRKSSKMR
jgi:hypothetical protein